MATILKKMRARWTAEPTAGAAITPGHLVEYSDVSTVQAHSTAAGVINGKFVALEDQAQGRGIDDAYASGDPVVVQAMLPGEQVQMIASAAVVANAFVESAGDGRVRTLTTTNPVGRALNAAASAGDRITVEIV